MTSQEAKALLAAHEQSDTTVWYIVRPSVSVSAQWSSGEVYASLRSAIEFVRDDRGEHLCDVILHDQIAGKDTQLDGEQVAALIRAL